MRLFRRFPTYGLAIIVFPGSTLLFGAWQMFRGERTKPKTAKSAVELFATPTATEHEKSPEERARVIARLFGSDSANDFLPLVQPQNGRPPVPPPAVPRAEPVWPGDTSVRFDTPPKPVFQKGAKPRRSVPTPPAARANGR